jgi:energy-coupling factor transport system substrate-specific component
MVLTACLAAVLEASKTALAAVPGVEVVTLLVILYTQVLGWRTGLCCVLVMTAADCFIYGPGMWVIEYLYIWPLLVFIAWKLKGQKPAMMAVLAGMTGLLFGTMCMPVTFIMLKGWQASVSWWLAGLGVDLLHGISNFIVTMLLYTPLSRALKSLTTHVIR